VTDMHPSAPADPVRSRRALLVGALGGVAGLVAGGLGLAGETRAAQGGAVIQGVNNDAGISNTTLTTNSTGTALYVQQNGSGTALRGSATGTDAIAGFFTSTSGPGFSAVTANRQKFGAYVANDDALKGSGAALRVAGKQNNGISVTTSNISSTAITAIAAHNAIAIVAGGYGVFAQSSSDGGNAGVFGYATAATGPTFGIIGTALSPDGTGVSGTSDSLTGLTYGVYGQVVSSAGFGLFSNGNAHVAGTLSKSAGMFKIDHPLEPASKYLCHSFVESPDMLNVYSGTVALDGDGQATVELPDWFESLNREVRYQLTAVGSAAPDLHVKTKVDRGRFTIAGGRGGQEVSWQLTGIRQDAYAKKHPIVVEQSKKGAEAGKYLHPELFGKPATMGLHPARRTPRPPQLSIP
jgi:hypothetical protein